MVNKRSGFFRAVRWGVAGGLLGAGWVVAHGHAPAAREVLAAAVSGGAAVGRGISSHLAEVVLVAAVLLLDRLGRHLGVESKSFFHLVSQLGGVLLRLGGWILDAARGLPRRPVRPRAVRLAAESEDEAERRTVARGEVGP